MMTGSSEFSEGTFHLFSRSFRYLLSLSITTCLIACFFLVVPHSLTFYFFSLFAFCSFCCCQLLPFASDFAVVTHEEKMGENAFNLLDNARHITRVRRCKKIIAL